MKIFMALAGVLALGACGSGSRGNGSMAGNSRVTSSQVSALDQAAAGVSTSAASYGADAATISTPTDCAAAVQQYTAQVQPDVDDIASMSSEMDDAMSSMGQAVGADVECGTTVMQQELAHHLAVACTSQDMAANQAEITRHTEAMHEFADHMRMRADELTTMMGADGEMMGGGMGSVEGGWTTPAGGMIPFDQTMPGCTYSDGQYQPDGGATTASGR